jgi:membrane-associated phospholipid phosphatase
MKKSSLLLVLLFPYLLFAQTETNDTINSSSTVEAKQLLVPGTLFVLSVCSSISWDHKLQEQAATWKGNTKIDDVLIFTPGVALYALDWCGIHSKHNFTDKTVIAATTAILTLGSAYVLKETTNVMRPDGSDNQSFPSMHTAVAFACAELFRQEYKDESIWYGIAGYGIATGCGFLRVYNNKHWLSDTLAGAGLGILSAQAAYWLFPTLKKLYNKGENEISFSPSVSEYGISLGFSARF